MNHIFDWQREQIKDRTIRHGCPSISCWMKTSKNCDKCELKSLQVREIFDVINEAEAKWESECCEWNPAKTNSNLIASPHMALYQLSKEDLRHIPYCPFCGKPIKISEVE